MKAFSIKRQLASGISTAAVVAWFACATSASAQTTSGVQGHVEGAGAGSTVTVTDLNTGHSDSTRVDAGGNYLIVGLPPSTYRVQSGKNSQTVTVPLGQTVTVDLAAAAASTGAAIVVVGARSKDVKTPVVTTNVSRFQIENLPNGDRNFLNFAALAPGVTVSPPTLSNKARQVQAGAINSDNTNTYIDGLSIKNLVNHGGTLGQNYSSGNPFPSSAVDQFNVETQNFAAEFSDAASAVISTVTKTGGNQFHGEIFGEWQPSSFISRNYDERTGHLANPTGSIPKPRFSTKYYGGDFGGPIIKDKLTFFVDFEGTNKVFESNPVNVYPGTYAGLSPAAQTYEQSARSQYNGTFPEKFKEKLYFGKLTYFATPDDTINISAFVRQESNLAIPSGVETLQASTRDRNNEDRYEAWWTHRGHNWLNELYVAHDASANGAIPNTPGSQYIVTYSGSGTPNTGNPALLILGGNNFIQNDHQYQTVLKDNVTVNAGTHTIKFGGTIDFTKLQRLEDNNGNGTYYYDAATFTGVGSSVPYAASINTAAVSPVTGKDTQIGLFAQDSWRPDDHWLINYGLRWDYETNATNEKFVTPPDIVAALLAYPGFGPAGINPNDYISNGHNRKAFLGEFQPRLGISYDVRGDRDLVLFAGAGRYYDRSLFIDSAIETIKDYYQRVSTIYASSVGPLPSDPAALRALASISGTAEVDLLNNHTKIPYSDEVDAGVRKRFGPINTSITFSYIRSNNIYQEVVGNRYPNGTYGGDAEEIFVFNGIPYARGIFFNSPGSVGAVFGAPLSAAYDQIYIGNSQGKARYVALYFTADKPYTEASGWGFSSALTISSSRSNDPRVTNQIADPFMFDAVTIGQQGWGPVTGMERWRYVGTGTVKLPFDVKLSTVVTLSAGPSYHSVLCNVPLQTGGVDCYLTNFGVFRPHGIGYKNIDFNISKTFKMPWNHDHALTVYFEALNAFDFVNRNYSEWQGGFANYPASPSQKHDITGVASQGRNFKIGAKFTF